MLFAYGKRLGGLLAIALGVMVVSTLLINSLAMADETEEGDGRVVTQASPVLIKEGFEAAGIPTAGDGWKAQDAAGGSAATWLPSPILSYDGSQSAVVKYPDSGLDPVDTWLLSPAFTLDDQGVVNFVTWGDKNICVNVDWCDLEVWLIKGETLGDSDDISLGLVDAEWTGIFSETHHTRIIPAGLGEIRVGFHYSSTDGSAVYLDAIEIRDLTADVIYEAIILDRPYDAPLPFDLFTTVSGGGGFSYNYATHILTSSIVIENPNGESLTSLGIYSGTAAAGFGALVHDFEIISTTGNVVATASIRLSPAEEESLVAGRLYAAVAEFSSIVGGSWTIARGQIVQKLPITMGFEAGRVPADGWEMQDGVSGGSSAATWVIPRPPP